MPPRTGLLPSSAAASLTHRFSLPSAFFQLTTVAPKSSTSTDSPLGSRADTRELSAEMLTTGCGARVMGEICAGRWARSIVGVVVAVLTAGSEAGWRQLERRAGWKMGRARKGDDGQVDCDDDDDEADGSQFSVGC
jgi:hypothetical protein